MGTWIATHRVQIVLALGIVIILLPAISTLWGSFQGSDDDEEAKRRA
ncbi:MAG: hypothetical protein ACM3TU_02740 [Bacillota bacterium]